MKLLTFSVFDLRRPEAVAELTREVGEEAARGIMAQAGGALFVSFGREGFYTLAWTQDEDAVLEALEAGLAEVGTWPPRSGGLRVGLHVGPQLEAKCRTSFADYERRHTVGAPSRLLQ